MHMRILSLIARKRRTARERDDKSTYACEDSGRPIVFRGGVTRGVE